MQYFERDGKFNWVDENNVLLGYDSGQSCCEDADWFLAVTECSNHPGEQNRTKELDWENWEFDTMFFKQDDLDSGRGGESGGIAIFRLLRKRVYPAQFKYLHIFNSHNGYYGHGFEFKTPYGMLHNGGL